MTTLEKGLRVRIRATVEPKILEGKGRNWPPDELARRPKDLDTFDYMYLKYPKFLIRRHLQAPADGVLLGRTYRSTGYLQPGHRDWDDWGEMGKLINQERHEVWMVHLDFPGVAYHHPVAVLPEDLEVLDALPGSPPDEAFSPWVQPRLSTLEEVLNGPQKNDAQRQE
jgi:hypothetical protein